MNYDKDLVVILAPTLSRQRAPITARESFFHLSHHDVPRIDVNDWSLSFAGRLGRRASLHLEELARLKKTELTVCMECAGNGGVGMHGLVGNAVWGGVRLSTILEELAVRPEAREVVFWGADGAEERLRGNRYPSRFARSLPVADALDENVLLAYEMNGEPLAPEHGFPLRLIVPGWYGIAHVKWLTRVEVIDYRFMGWFMAKDYVTVRGERRGESIVHRATSVGRARLKSIITRVARPVAGARDSLAIHGFAWSDGTGVAAVEVRIDDGPFVSAELEPPETRFAWTPFHVRWRDATKGRHRLVSRARDAEGRRQPSDRQASCRSSIFVRTATALPNTRSYSKSEHAF